MKAMKIANGAAKLTDVAAPSPGVSDVVVDVAAVGVASADVAAAVEFGGIPGRWFAGTVSEIGHAVTGIAVGDVVVAAPPGSCGSCGPCLRGDDAYCLRADSLYDGLRPGLDRDGALADQVCVPGSFLALAPDIDLAVGALASDLGVQAFNAIRTAGDAITAGNTVAVLGTSALARYTSALLAATTAVEILAVSDYSDDNKQRLLADFASEGIVGVLVMDRTQAACDFATAIVGTGGSVVLADNGDGEALVQPMPFMRYEASVRAIGHGNRKDLIELLRVLRLAPVEVDHRRVCLDEFANFDAERLAEIEPGLVVVV